MASSSPLPFFRVTPYRLLLMADWLCAHDTETKVPTVIGQCLKRRAKKSKNDFCLDRAAKYALKEATKLSEAKNMPRNEQYQELMTIVQNGLPDWMFDDFVKCVLKPAKLNKRAKEMEEDWEYRITPLKFEAPPPQAAAEAAEELY